MYKSDTPDLDQVLTVERFRAWLTTQTPRARVGHAVTASGCPLARYLAAAAAVHQPLIAGMHLFSFASEPVIVAELPAWAIRYVRELDRGRLAGHAITARAALTALDRALAFGDEKDSP